MKQRATMAISTALNPKLIIADEPTSALDVVVQRQVMMTLGRVQKELEAAAILIGHDMGLVAQFSDMSQQESSGARCSQSSKIRLLRSIPSTG